MCSNARHEYIFIFKSHVQHLVLILTKATLDKVHHWSTLLSEKWMLPLANVQHVVLCVKGFQIFLDFNSQDHAQGHGEQVQLPHPGGQGS